MKEKWMKVREIPEPYGWPCILFHSTPGWRVGGQALMMARGQVDVIQGLV